MVEPAMASPKVLLILRVVMVLCAWLCVRANKKTQWPRGWWHAGRHADSVCSGEGDGRARYHRPRCGSSWRSRCIAVPACCDRVRAQARQKRWGRLSRIGLNADMLCFM